MYNSYVVSKDIFVSYILLLILGKNMSNPLHVHTGE